MLWYQCHKCKKFQCHLNHVRWNSVFHLCEMICFFMECLFTMSCAPWNVLKYYLPLRIPNLWNAASECFFFYHSRPFWRRRSFSRIIFFPVVFTFFSLEWAFRSVSLCSDTGKALYKGIIYFLIKKLNMIIKYGPNDYMYSAPMHNCWQASFCMLLFLSCTALLCRCFVPKNPANTKTSSSPSGVPTE